MRVLVGIVAVLPLLSATPAPAQFGEGAAHPPEAETSPWVRKPPEPEPRPRHPDYHRHWRGYPYYYYRGDLDDDPDPPPPEPLPPISPPVMPPEPPAEPLLPDPQGPLSLSPAPGVGLQAPRWRVGEPLPSDLPRVALDWRRYGLPRPEAGRVYVRVGRDVLLITAGERVVEKVMPAQ